jgi:hypothetical protein
MVIKLKVLFWIGVCFAAASMGFRMELFAADSPPSRTEKQLQTTIVHVDKYGVYAPNLIFYWDSGMSKQKVSALTGVAEQLRNKDAVITYSTISDITKDKRPVLIDIAPLKRDAPKVGDSSLVREPSKPSPVQEEKTAPPPPKAESKTVSEEMVLPTPRKEAPPDQPKPFLPGSPLITRAEVVNFVNNCIDAAQTKDIERSLACYGEQVDYYSKGTVNKEFIRRDKGYYFRNWDKINSSIDGDIVLIVIDQPDLKIAKFNSRFSVENAKNTASGRAENIWKIQKVGNELKIVDEKQRIIERYSR